MNKEIYNYCIQYQESIYEKLVEILDELKPITLRIYDIPKSYTNIFTTYIDDNYHFVSPLNLYLHKDYFQNKSYIYKYFHYRHYHIYHVYDEKTKSYTSTEIDPLNIRNLLPSLLVNENEDNESNDYEMIKIDHCIDHKHTFILKEKTIRTKKAVTTK